MDYKYNELEYAKLIYDKGFQTKHIPTELRLLAVYMRDILEMKPKERREELYKYCEVNIPNYNKAKYFKTINRALQQATKKTNKLITIKEINIYQNEVDYINSIQLTDNHKKVLLALLVHKKLSKIVYNIKNADNPDKKDYNMVFFNGGIKIYNNIKKISNIPTSIKLNEDIIHDFLNYRLNDADEKYLVTSLHNGLIILNFIDELSESGDVAITIKNFNNVGWYLDYYNNVKNIKLCKHCNQPFKQTKNDILYCSEHKQYYIPMKTKTITCIDCDKEVDVDGIVKNKKRCDECQKKYNNSSRMKNYYKQKFSEGFLHKFDNKYYLLKDNPSELIKNGYKITQIISPDFNEWYNEDGSEIRYPFIVNFELNHRNMLYDARLIEGDLSFM